MIPCDDDRGPPRLRRGAPSEGFGAISGPPISTVIEARHGLAGARRALGGLGGHGEAPISTVIEARHGSAGARRAYGGLGAMAGPPSQQSSRRATAPPGRDEHMGVWGPWRGPHLNSHRGAPRLRRGATSIWGFGGHGGAPISTVIE